MFKIGEFSRFSQVTVKTLRYYDQLGLLKPAEIDRFTGYRYYSARQLPRLNRIMALKDMGLSLEQIADLLEKELSIEQIRGMLRLKQVEIQQKVQEEQARLALVEWRLKQMEQEETMSAQEVVIKQIAAQPVVSVRATIPTTGIPNLFTEIYTYLGQRTLNPAGPSMGIYYDEEFHEETIDVEVAVPVTAIAPGEGRVKSRELPALDKVACIIHEGKFDTLRATYTHLLGWIEANGYRLAGPIREVYVQWALPGQDPSTNITEIQLPVEKI
jgi:effector-binding domain-containing protein